jgi:hypothetical protein
MLKNSLKIFLLLLLTIVSACRFDNDRSNENTAVDVIPMISEWANQMNVFPICFIARWSDGPVYEKEKGFWYARYELTFDQYELFYKFKYLSQTISKKELMDAIAYIDKATPKEKALVLTMIYIYERTHRKPLPIYTKGNDSLDEYEGWRPPILPVLKTDKTVSRHQWKKWIGILEQYSKDDTVAFPAITENVKILREAWEKEQLRVLKMAMSLGMIDLVEALKREEKQAKVFEQFQERRKLFEKSGKRFYAVDETQTRIIPISRTLDWNGTKEVRRKASIEDRKKIDALTEYIDSQHDDGYSGVISQSGNSSSHPKTVGDIATQLLMSRLKYDE